MTTKNYYLEQVLEDVRQYQKENYDNPVEDVCKLSFKELLRDYLEWNGIFGYSEYIITLIKYALPISEEDLER